MRQRDDDYEIIERLKAMPPTAGLTTREAAVYSGLSESTLEKARIIGGGIPFVRAGNRAIRYRMIDIDQYMEERRASSTSEYR